MSLIVFKKFKITGTSLSAQWNRRYMLSKKKIIFLYPSEGHTRNGYYAQSQDYGRMLSQAVLHFKNQHCLQACNLKSRIFSMKGNRFYYILGLIKRSCSCPDVMGNQSRATSALCETDTFPRQKAIAGFHSA